MASPRILFIDQYADLGGGQRILLDMLRHFKASGWESHVALPVEGPLTEILRREDVAASLFNLPGMAAGRKSFADKLAFLPAAFSARHDLIEIARKFDADLLFCNGPRAALPSVLAATAMELPVVCAVHLIFQGIERSILNWCFRRQCVRGITFCSTVARRPFEDVCANKWTATGNWSSPEFLSAPKGDFRGRFGIDPDAIAVGVVGRLSEKKGQRMFLEAMGPLANSDPRLQLVIAGSGDFEDPREEERLTRLADTLGIGGQTAFLGSVNDPIAVYDSLDILVVPSLWEEPFGLVAVEGMARGLPVVATNSGGLADIVQDGTTGLLADKSASSIELAVRRLIEDRELRLRFGRAGLDRVRSDYAPEPRLDALDRACASIVSQRKLKGAA